MADRIWWWPAPADGETVPDHPPIEITDRVAARYLIGEHWLAGELNAIWTSERPGVTGPANFEATHRDHAQSPPPDITDGWRYYWSQPGQGDSA